MKPGLPAAGAVKMEAGRPEPSEDVDFRWRVRIPMRDAVGLSATLYRPPGDERTPVIFILTRYIADSYHERAYFAQKGYGFALVDRSGRGNSEGEFEPMVNDVFHSGTLKEKAPDESPPDQYVYHPPDVRPAELEQEEVKAYLTDQR